MATRTDTIEAVVLRTTRFGEADVIANVHALGHGRRGVIAKGARRAKSRLGARLEPFLVARIELVEGRGDLAIVRHVDVLDAHEHLRASWRGQQLGAAAIDLVRGLGVEHEVNDPMHHLVRSLLRRLDSLAGRGGLDDERRGCAVETAFTLKLLHAAGVAPQLGACVRCGDEAALVAYSAHDGGVVCAGCRQPGDAALDRDAYEVTTRLVRASLAEVEGFGGDDLPALRVLGHVRAAVAVATLVEHAGIRVPHSS